MILLIGSCVLTAVSLISQFMLSRKSIAGWYVGVLFQLLATPYDVVTHQYAFILLTPVSVGVCFNGIRKWRSDKETTD